MVGGGAIAAKESFRYSVLTKNILDSQAFLG
jgi:hypothetical protein